MDSDYKNFKRGLLPSPKCKDCRWGDCEIVYDSHHEEYFSVTCGLVLMSMGVFVFDYCDEKDKYDELYNRSD